MGNTNSIECFIVKWALNLNCQLFSWNMPGNYSHGTAATAAAILYVHQARAIYIGMYMLCILYLSFRLYLVA